MTSRIITVITSTAVTLADFKQFIKWESSDTSEDTTMNAVLLAATQEAGMFTRRICVQGTWRTFLDRFPYCLKLDVHPILVSSIVVKYYDTNNVLQTLLSTNYFVKDNGPDDFVEIVFDGTMPSVYDRWEPIYIEYTAGYALGSIPERIKTGIFEKAASDFENRTSEQSGSMSSFSRKYFNYQQAWYPYKMMG